MTSEHMENQYDGYDRGDEDDLALYRDYDEDLLIGVQRTQAVALTAIVCVSFIGNIAVLIILFSVSRYALRPTGLILRQLLGHLCVGDLAYAVLTILPRTINILTFPRFYGGYFVCRLVKFLQLVPVYVCPFLTVVCSVERYSNTRTRSTGQDALSVVNRRRISWRESRSFAHVLSFWAWLTAMVLSAPNILAFRYEYLDDAGTIGACVYQVREAYERLWMTFLTCATWLIPLLIVLSFCTVSMVRYYAKRFRRGPSVIRVGDDPYEDDSNGRLLKFFTGVIFTKFLLWTPFNVTNMVGSYWRSVTIGENVSVAVTLASNCSCCVPAVGFFIFEYSHFRQRIVEFFSKCSRGAKVTKRNNAVDRGPTKNLISEADPLPLGCPDEPQWPLRANVEEKSSIMFTV